MTTGLSRREAILMLAASGTACLTRGLSAQSIAPSSKAAAATKDDKIAIPQQEIPVLHRTQVLVIGAGCAGFSAAVGAARAGAKTILAERYGQLGGLFTSGIVPLVIGATLNGKDLCVRGVSGELMARLNDMDRGIRGYKYSKDGFGHMPVVDVEATKWLMMVMLEEAGVKLLYHSWCTDVIMDGKAIKGAVFESKQGCFAILADTVVDTSGDGDVFAFAGASCRTARNGDAGLPFRLKNLDSSPEYTKDPGKGREAVRKRIWPDQKVYTTSIPDVAWAVFAQTPLNDVDWVNHGGSNPNPLVITDLTKAECKLRKNAWKIAEFVKKIPTYEKVELIEVAPMLGPRITRILDGSHVLTMAEMKDKASRPDAIAIAPWLQSGIPYGILLPKDVDNLTVGGRCVSAEGPASGELRLVPYCMMTGHAAGVGAALAALGKTTPSRIDVADVRKELLKQGAFLK